MKTKRHNVAGTAALSAAGLIACAGSLAHSAVTYRAVALSGTSGPLGPGMGSQVYSDLSNASAGINNAGAVIFRSATTDTTSSAGVWVNTSGTNGVIAFAGQNAPDGVAYSNAGFNAPNINNAGHTAWRQATNAMFGHSGGSDGMIARTTTVAPGTGGATTASFSFPAPLLSQDGRAAYIGSLTLNTGNPPVTFTAPNANNGGLWIGTPGAMNLALRQNDAVTALAGDGSIRVGSFTSSGLTVSNGGRFASLNALQGSVTTGAATGNDQAILSNRTGSLEIIARRGDQVPGAAPGTFYRALGTSMGMNNAGRVVFSSTLRDGAGTTITNGSLITDNGGPLGLVAQGGLPLPAITNANGNEFVGVNWGSSFSDPVISGNNIVAFKTGGLTGTGITPQNSSAIFTLNDSGTFTKMMRTDDVAPVGLADDGTLIRYGGLQGGLSVNTRGQVAFSSLLSGFGVNGLIGNNLALFATDLSGQVQLIVRRGTDFEVAPGDVRLVTSIGGLNTSGGQDGRAVSLNNYSEIVFSLGFADGSSGVFTATVPAPAGVAALGLAGLFAARRRRG